MAKAKKKKKKSNKKKTKKTRLQQFIDVYSEHLIVEDNDYFAVVFGCCMANLHLDSKPVWLYAVGVSRQQKWHNVAPLVKRGV